MFRRVILNFGRTLTFSGLFDLVIVDNHYMANVASRTQIEFNIFSTKISAKSQVVWNNTFITYLAYPRPFLHRQLYVCLLCARVQFYIHVDCASITACARVTPFRRTDPRERMRHSVQMFFALDSFVSTTGNCVIVRKRPVRLHPSRRAVFFCAIRI